MLPDSPIYGFWATIYSLNKLRIVLADPEFYCKCVWSKSKMNL